MADDYLSTGFYNGERLYNFTSDIAASASVTVDADIVVDVEGELRKIEDEIRDCRNCPLCEKRRSTVAGEGVSRPLAMVIGEGPGADEDASGRPFVGAAGQLLDKMLAAIGLSRQTNCFIANVVKCRPPGNRDPEPEEKAACMPFLRRQISILRPQAILAAGRVPAQTLLQTTESISRLRGRWSEWRLEQNSAAIQLLPTFHPSYLLRDESQKPLAWDDLKKFARRLAAMDASYDAASASLRKKYKI